MASSDAQKRFMALQREQTRLLQDIARNQSALLEQQHSPQETNASRVKWEYAEISYAKTTLNDPAYIWLFRDGKLKRIGDIHGPNKAMVALERMGKQGWELVSAVTGIGDWGPQLLRLFLKRPKHD